MLRALILGLFCFINLAAQAQEEILARNYMEQGAYQKAAMIYEDLVEKNPANTNMISSLVEAYQQLEAYDKAETALLKSLQTSNNLIHLEVDLGYNYQLQGNTEAATLHYNKALKAVAQEARFAYLVGRTFQKYSLLDEAALAYNTAAEADPRYNFDPQLALIYGEQGDIEKMLNTYINLIERNEKYQSIAQRYFNEFITEDPENEANKIFRKLLLTRMQEEPNLLYNRLLSWLFIQQKEYNKAFLQEKAIAKRSNNDLNGIIVLAEVAENNNEFELATSMYEYLINQTSSADLNLFANQKLLELRIQNASADQLKSIKTEFQKLIQTYGQTPETLALQTAYAHFLAFKMNEKKEASDFLEKALKLKINRFQEARIKMELADILVLEERFNAALIYYSQIQKNLKDNILAQEARFKVAKTSYYKGDFEWAKTQLKVLKSSAEQLIANDAQDLYLLITDNTVHDSTQTALQEYARADLLLFQNKDQEALAIYTDILQKHEGKAIEDEALLAQAILYEKAKNFEAAAANYLKIIEVHGEDILADDAHYRLGNLYAEELQQPEKAKEQFEEIIFKFADSIFYVDAQQKYRKLRGDAIN
ncbi:tetratricopeptide repeat protein [Leeuwenhoekiella aestuarii]|uniref:Tetratricopeptide repeat protein n=1 Tax=Leeuwenhoekiella aestuarii TaxID=2249426 RepID=A0A4Q0NTG4_9FLAO|nr:tetratricopeptide repeat protein [Leeuwenhoekiella aestuarii]RXG14302.1 tetratricopeptide repeat protein [Leeuwenhoekiella aestuarii]RXG19051.1 tetratricopeptide repeat protein [Leeuwenhoekiella aestuarii]